MRPITLIVLGIALTSTSAAGQQHASSCRPTESVVQLPGLSEASGLAVSRRVPGRLWTHNDSGEPLLFALDARGSVVGRVRLSGASVEDWEAVAVGPCGAQKLR